VKLQFGLLWIEDNYSPQEEKEVRAGAAATGFELEIVNSIDGSDLDSLAEQQRKFYSFDLVLLDLKLSGGAKGDELAPRVRQLFHSTPILFYSGSDTENGLRERMAKDKVEGVFCASRSNFTSRASELIQDYAHTLNRLSGMRGLAMEVVAEVDIICRGTIAALAAAGFEAEAIALLEKAVCDQSASTLAAFPTLTGLSERMDHPAADSMKSFSTFRELIKKYVKALPVGDRKDRLSALILETRNYRTDVIVVRNVLGHALENRNDAGWLILDRDGQPYMTVADFPKHRSSFLQYLRAMREIAQLLVAK
jgi:CheY-like chemotaxis protein